MVATSSQTTTVPIYRKKTGGFTKDGKYRLGQVLLQTRMRQDEGYGLSLQDFAKVVNDHWQQRVIDKDKLWRLENAAVVRPKTADLTYLAPFTWSEAASRSYTVEELIAIGKEELDPQVDAGNQTPNPNNPINAKTQ